MFSTPPPPLLPPPTPPPFRRVVSCVGRGYALQNDRTLRTCWGVFRSYRHLMGGGGGEMVIPEMVFIVVKLTLKVR